MTSSLYFLPPTSSPPWLLISSKISSVAFLWGMPQGAAGPESGVDTPNLMTSAASARGGVATASAATARNANLIREDRRFIASPSWSKSGPESVTGTIPQNAQRVGRVKPVGLLSASGAQSRAGRGTGGRPAGGT